MRRPVASARAGDPCFGCLRRVRRALRGKLEKDPGRRAGVPVCEEPPLVSWSLEVGPGADDMNQSAIRRDNCNAPTDVIAFLGQISTE